MDSVREQQYPQDLVSTVKEVEKKNAFRFEQIILSPRGPWEQQQNHQKRIEKTTAFPP